MTKKEIEDKIDFIILSLDDAIYSIDDLYECMIPHSFEVLSAFSDLDIILEDTHPKALLAISIPDYTFATTKEKTIVSVAIDNNIAVYSNLHYETPVNAATASDIDIAVAIYDSDGNIYDARVKGGGIKEDDVDSLAKTDKFVGSRTDLGRYDGMPLSASGFVLVGLPSDIKNKYTETKIDGIIRKHIAAGYYGMQIYYDSNSLESMGWDFTESVDV